MADGEDSPSQTRKLKSKIPRYVHSKVPVCSLEHKKILKDVKSKRIQIENKTSELKKLSSDYEDVKRRNEIKTSNSTESQEVTKYNLPSSRFRSNIVTPGGTKRKVNQSRYHFKTKLKEVLSGLVVRNPTTEVQVDELLQRLEIELPGAKSERFAVLTMISELYGIKQKHKGKRKEAFYQGLSFVEKMETQLQTNEPMAMHSIDSGCRSHPEQEQVSPTAKIRKDSATSSQPRCKGRLNFSGVVNTDSSLSQFPVQFNDILKGFYSMQDTFEKMSGDMQRMTSEQEELLLKVEQLQHTIGETQSSADAIIDKQQELINLYKDITDNGSLLGGLLSLAERNEIKIEVAKAKKMLNLGFRDKHKDLLDLFDPLLFAKLVDKMREECPTISNMLEQLVLSSNTSRNSKKTQSMKMKAAVHLLGSLMDIRDQHGGNDIPVLFGLLCLCYGAGPSMISILQHLGMSESFSTLTDVLKNQLEHYKTLIKQRVTDDIPVITYQDNMQLMRTSMRHLRLSKLQKEKMKQGKMWDFTVRGWREADIGGIEYLFSSSETATEPQREVSGLVYSDTQIESNEEHYNSWMAFQEKNILSKLNVGLNAVRVDCRELASATIEGLQQEAAAMEKPQKTYIIEVPAIHEEFPLQGKKKTNIFPLPISHENQCTNLGVASNLDRFSEEFSFPCKTSTTYLPLKKSGKDFDLDRAYERYAFLKKLERHKEQQMEYDQILRHTEVDITSQHDEFQDYDQIVVLENNEESDTEADITV